MDSAVQVIMRVLLFIQVMMQNFESSSQRVQCEKGFLKNSVELVSLECRIFSESYLQEQFCKAVSVDLGKNLL